MAVEIPSCFLAGCNKDSYIVYPSRLSVRFSFELLAVEHVKRTSKGETGGPEELAVGTSCGNSGLRRHYAVSRAIRSIVKEKAQ